MEKTYDSNSVLLKLIYYCNKKKEIYFKRSDVTEYLVSSRYFTIPNKQGFDGNLSYFGFDIKNDLDGNRILLLRGKKLNEKCLSGLLNINLEEGLFKIVDDDKEIFYEVDSLIDNKTVEAKVFNVRKEIINRYSLVESETRLYGNKKMYSKNGIVYIFPDIVIDCINNKLLYEIVKTPKLERYNIEIVFPLYDNDGRYFDEKIINYDELGELKEEFCYFEYRLDDQMLAEYDIQEISNERIINLITNLQYNLADKKTTKAVLSNIRLNTGALRALALNRDNYKCVLCSVKNSKFLVCSHIKPWKTGEGQLDLNNVLTLCTLHDALFDKGYLSIDKHGDLHYLDDEVFEEEPIKAFLEKSNTRLSIESNDKMREYLDYHFSSIFRG